MSAARTAAIVTAALLAGLLAGCSPASSVSGETQTTASSVVATVPVGELSGLPTEIEVGDEIEVVIDTPGIEWTAVSSDPSVVQVEGGTRNPGVLRVTAVATGSAQVTLDGGSDGAQDSVQLIVIGS